MLMTNRKGELIITRTAENPGLSPGSLTSVFVLFWAVKVMTDDHNTKLINITGHLTDDRSTKLIDGKGRNAGIPTFAMLINKHT